MTDTEKSQKLCKKTMVIALVQSKRQRTRNVLARLSESKKRQGNAIAEGLSKTMNMFEKLWLFFVLFCICAGAEDDDY